MDFHELEALAKGHHIVAGADEAGRGPLAGPVVAAAVIYTPVLVTLGIKDSKKLSPGRREELNLSIHRLSPSVAVGICWPEEVDSMNIHHASLLAMERAVKNLCRRPEFVLVDGRFTLTGLTIPQKAVIKGDELSVTMGAASIVAKTARDRIMVAYHRLYPEYNFIQNKGYPTQEHRTALHAHGPTPIHRKTFSFT